MRIMATSRGNSGRNYPYHQQGPPYNTPRPNKSVNSFLSFMQQQPAGQPQRAPLLRQNPPMMGLPPHGATPFGRSPGQFLQFPYLYRKHQQMQATNKKRTNAIPIINPDTREEVEDTNSSEASGNGLLNSHRNASISSSGSINKKREFREAEHKWVRVRDQLIPEDKRELQSLFRKFQGILNKLTPQKFSDLAMEALALTIDTEEKLQGCIDRTYENAIKGPGFSLAYANLCRVLATIKVTVKEDDGKEIKITFLRLLLRKCQKEFEKEKKDDITCEVHLKAIADAPSLEEKKRKQEEFNEWETIARRRSLGNIRFIGELFKLKMLSEGIMHDCILRLLRSISDDESLECFCRLITTTGKELDHSQAKARMDKYFQRIDEIIEKKKISLRIKLMLQDVQDLRMSNWVPRRQEGLLRTIDQIHHEAKQTAAVGIMKSHSQNRKSKSHETADVRKAANALDEDAVRRKTGTIVYEFAETKNLQEATDCIMTLKPSGLLNVFVAESILFSLERSPRQRECTGNLLDCAFKKRLISKKKMHSGLKEVINIVDDLEVDIPKVWDFLGEILCPLFISQCLVLTDYSGTIMQAGIEYKTPKALSRLLQQCAHRESKRAASDIWIKSKLSWSSVGLEEDEDEFLEREKLQFLHAPSITNSNKPPTCTTFVDPPYFKDLVVLFGRSDTSNDRILEWIKDQKINMDLMFIISLSRASVEASVSGEGDSCILSDKNFRKRLPLVKKCLEEFQLELEVLNAMQCSMDRLKHPPSMLSTVFWTLFDCEVVSETVCYKWQRKERESSGRGIALQTAKPFFDWLGSTNEESDDSEPPHSSSTTFVDPPYFKDLVTMFKRLDTSNDEILEWIKKDQKIKIDLVFIRSLSKATVEASVSGEGDKCILSGESLRRRLPVVKKWVDENEEYQLEVLNTMQYSMDRLPPSMLNTLFWALLDAKVVSKTSCHEWRRIERETNSKGMALQITEPFFEWLESADQEN